MRANKADRHVAAAFEQLARPFGKFVDGHVVLVGNFLENRHKDTGSLTRAL